MTTNTSGYNILTGQVSTSFNPNESQQIAILFDYLTEETSSVEADITDNWVESNYSIQDHIAVKPRIYRLKGCVGEVVYKNQWKILDAAESLTSQHPILQKTLNAVNAVSSLSGVVSNYTQAAINIAKQVESSFDRYKNIWQNFTQQNQFVNKHQKAVYLTLMQMLQTRTPVKLTELMFKENPGWFSENNYDRLYYLQNVSAHQGDSSYISDIEVTIKEFRVATTITTKADKKKFAGPIATQKTSKSSTGQAKGINIKQPMSDWTKQAVKETLGKATEIREAVPKNPIQKFFYDIKKQQMNYNDSLNNYYVY